MEVYEKELVSTYFSGLTLIENVISQVQSIQVYQHQSLGKILVINGEVQNVEKWAPLYHEALVHIPMMFIDYPQSVLILGGGDLFAAEEVLKYPFVKRVVICDYDPEVINLTEKYYPHAKAVLADPRVSILSMDAKFFLRNNIDKYDLVIDDCFNLVEDFAPEDKIFRLLHEHLTEDIGVCSSLIYRHIFDKEIILKTKGSLFSQYETVLSMVAVPEYPGVLHLLTMWGKSKFLSQSLTNSKNKWHIEMQNKGTPIGCLFDPRFCKFYLYLPNYIKPLLLA